MAASSLPIVVKEATLPYLSSILAFVAGLVRFMTVFLLGGIVCSAVLAWFAAVLALGQENVKRVRSMVSMVVATTWDAFIAGLRETKRVIRENGKWNWRRAWKTLKEQLFNAKQAAVVGIDAIRMEATKIAVGKPGLIPLQYMLDRLTPYVLKTVMTEATRDNLKAVKNDLIRRMELMTFSIGSACPQLVAARVYDVGDDAMAFDVDVDWNSDVEMDIKIIPKSFGLSIPTRVTNINFSGCLRIQLTPLIDEPPGYGAAVVSLASTPKFTMNIFVVGMQLKRFPWLKATLLKEIQKGIEKELLWPKCIVVPTLVDKRRPVLTKQVLDELAVNNPLKRAEDELDNVPLLKKQLERFDPTMDIEQIQLDFQESSTGG